MKIPEFEITVKEFTTFQISTYRNSGRLARDTKKRRKNFAVYLFIFLVVLLINSKNSSTFVFTYALVAIPILVSIFRAKFQLEKAIEDAAIALSEGDNATSTLGKRTLEISEEHLEVVEEFETSKIQLKAFRKVSEDKLCIYLFKDNIHAVIVPKRAFINEDQMNEFLSIVRGRMQDNDKVDSLV